MGPRRLPALIATGGLALALGACTVDIGTWTSDDLGGPQTSEDRPIAGVVAVDLTTSGDLTVTLGSAPALTVTAPEDALPHLTSEVRDGVLELGIDRSGGIRGSITYELVVTDLSAVTVAGSGNVRADAAAGDRLDVAVSGSGELRIDAVDVTDLTVTVSGSGDVTLAGEAGHQAVVVAGSGTYRGDDLTSATTDVEVAGSGDAVLTVTDTLTAAVAGSGSVRHGGGAHVVSQVSGSGSVTER